jgi:cephalosporin hydroxylase
MSLGDLTEAARSIWRKHGASGLIGAGVDFLSRPVLQPLAARALRKRAAQARTTQELVDLALAFKFGNVGVSAMQVRQEIVALAEEIRARRPQTVLEIGTAKGGTLFLFSRLAAPTAQLMSVDLPFGRFGGGYPSYKAALYRSFALPGQTIHLIRADSHAPQTFDQVKSLLNGQTVDFLFIDGDHSLQGVRKDFELFSQFLTDRGLIAFHDIVPGPPDAVGGVPVFWQELKKADGFHAETVELVSDWQQGGLGIGVLRDFHRIPEQSGH